MSDAVWVFILSVVALLNATRLLQGIRYDFPPAGLAINALSAVVCGTLAIHVEQPVSRADGQDALVRNAINLAVRAERERCAKIAVKGCVPHIEGGRWDRIYSEGWNAAAETIAKAIRSGED